MNNNIIPMPQQPFMPDSASNSAIEAMILEYQQLVDQIQPNKQATSKKKIVTFPIKLYFILKLVPKYDLDHIISWQVHGRNFVIRDRNLFLHLIANRLFESTKFSSFQRQLNVYDFQIVPSKHKTDKGAYFHPQFLRGRFDLCQTMVRVRIGGERRRSSTSSSQSSSFTAVPNFYALPYCYDSEDGARQEASPDPAAHAPADQKTSSSPRSPSNPTTDARPSENSYRYKSEPYYGKVHAQQGFSLHHQFCAWDSFDNIESRSPKEQAVDDMILLDGFRGQKLSLIQALTRTERSLIPLTLTEGSLVPHMVSHDGLLCDYSTGSTMRLRPDPCKIDWHNAFSEAMSINLDNYKTDDAASCYTSSTAGNTRDAPTKVSLEQVLEEVEDEIQTIFEEDDFHGLLFHFVDDEDDTEDCGSSVASNLSAMFEF